jgi:hypothetical protein
LTTRADAELPTACQGRGITGNTDEDVATWGELREGLHTAGYTFERACSRLVRLLEEDRWKVGGRFKDVNAFLVPSLGW